MQKKNSKIVSFKLNWTSNRFGKSSTPPLEEVPETGQAFLHVPSPRLRRSSSPRTKTKAKENEYQHDSYHTICAANITDFKAEISGNQHHAWVNLENGIVDLFNKCGDVSDAQNRTLSALHNHVRNLLDSNIGTFVYDRFKSRMLSRGMSILREKLSGDENFKKGLCSTWECFFTIILPALDCILFRVKTNNALTIRQTAMVAFRDDVLFKVNFEEKFSEMLLEEEEICHQIKHMLLILQNVNECSPPHKNKLRLEAMTARIVDPYLGYKGLYIGAQLLIPSDEPAINARRKSVDQLCGRRVSRPLSVQPKQLETLNELFDKVLRKQSQC